MLASWKQHRQPFTIPWVLVLVTTTHSSNFPTKFSNTMIHPFVEEEPSNQNPLIDVKDTGSSCQAGVGRSCSIRSPHRFSLTRSPSRLFWLSIFFRWSSTEWIYPHAQEWQPPKIIDGRLSTAKCQKSFINGRQSVTGSWFILQTLR